VTLTDESDTDPASRTKRRSLAVIAVVALLVIVGGAVVALLANSRSEGFERMTYAKGISEPKQTLVFSSDAFQTDGRDLRIDVEAAKVSQNSPSTVLVTLQRESDGAALGSESFPDLNGRLVIDSASPGYDAGTYLVDIKMTNAKGVVVVEQKR
jgi:hypothetical protein